MKILCLPFQINMVQAVFNKETATFPCLKTNVPQIEIAFR